MSGQPPRNAVTVSVSIVADITTMRNSGRTVCWTIGQTEGEVALQAALVELVEDDRADGFQIRVVVQHPQQDAAA